MDFGSSHVYAGSPYYSDVPTEEAKTSAAPQERPDTIYEAVNETNRQNEYDPVAFDSSNVERREYDLVPYEPELDASNSDSSKHQHPKRSLPSSVLHKAKKVNIFKNKKKMHKSVSEVEETPPPPPPRPSIVNKPLPPIPGGSARLHRQDKPLPPIPEPTSTPPISQYPKIPPKPPSLKLRSAKQPTPVAELTEILSTYSLTDDSPSETITPLQAAAPTPKPLYPTLPNVYADVNKNYGNPGLEASAPPVETALAQQALPTAPSLSASMVKRDSREKNKAKSQYAAADTNVVSVKLGIIESSNNSMVWAMPPTLCSTCQAILFHHASELEPGVCRFCGSTNANVTEAVLPLVGNESDVTYVLNQDSQISDDPIIVFCVDTSGSMCVTSQMKDSITGTCFMSRLQAVQDGILQQLNQLKQTKPKSRVAIVTFSDLVVSLGDGTPGQYLALCDAQLYDTDYIKTAASNALLPGFITHTHMQLCATVQKLKECGGTALGPALFLSVALASRKFGSQVILCTDGRANVGIGSLELESDYKMCHNFYKETSTFGIHAGTMVSILSIEGTDCRLVELGKVADKTAGKVKIAEVHNIGKEFQDILSSSLMATQVNVRIATQKQLYFDECIDGCSSLANSFVGNATQDTEITFKYGIKDSEESCPHSALFQLQVMYRLPNGCTCLRVITQSRPVTENRVLAEQGLNPAVVGTYASQLASKLVLDGDLRDAKLTTDAHKKLINRALSIRSTVSTRQAENDDDERIYGSVCYFMDELNQEIHRVAESVRQSPTPSVSSDAPPLPPRLSETPRSLSRSSSISSLSLPEVPNNPLATKEKLVEAVEHCPDEVARKLYKHRNACGKMFAAC